MRLLDIVYVIGLLGVIAAYAFLHINVIWVVGYLIILLVADLMPKRILTESLIAIVLFGVALFLALSGQSAIAVLVSAFLLIAAGLPGIIIYAIVTVFFHGYSPVQAITLVSEGILIILIVLHIVRFILTRILFVTFYIPIINFIPLIIEAGIVIAMVYLTISAGSPFYNTLQHGVNFLVKLI